jgi:hypothetical protein
MKQLTILLFAVISACATMAQKQPFEQYGYKVKIATLSKGKYVEHFDQDTIVQVGTVLLNRRSGKIVSFVKYDTTLGEYSLKPELVSRWMSPDPLAHEYYSLSPYTFVGNNPVIFVDPDGRRFYFAAGAGHDPGNTGYINKMLDAFRTYGGLSHVKDIDAHARPLMGIPRDALWSTGEYSEKPYYDLYNVSPAGFGESTSSRVDNNSVNWRIKSSVEQINADLESSPLGENEQFNLSGYSTGAVIMAQSALMLANEGKTIDNLVLIGATFTQDSDLSKALSENKNIKNIIRVDIQGDNVTKGVRALNSFLQKSDNHPHFKYAFGKDADQNRKNLAEYLKSKGVADFKIE